MKDAKDQTDNLVHLIKGSYGRPLPLDQNEELFVLIDISSSHACELDQMLKPEHLITVLASYGQLVPAFSHGDFTPLFLPENTCQLHPSYFAKRFVMN
ncbi:MAG: hypothetical protein ACTINM_03245 [Acetobacter cibinongensis]